MKLPFKILKLSSVVSAISLLFTLGSCTDDLKINADNQENSAGYTLGDGPYYFSFTLRQADNIPSRDGAFDPERDEWDLVYGTEKESQIDNMLFIFFDNAGNQLYCIPVTKFEKLPTQEEKDDIEFSFNAISTISLPAKDPDKTKEEQKVESIDSFIALVNYDEKWTSYNETAKTYSFNKPGTQDKASRTDVYAVTKDTTYQVKPDMGFLMTNSGQYDNTGKYLYYYQKAADEQLFYEKRSEARDNPVVIYVERVASRIDFKLIEDVTPVKAFYGEPQFGAHVYELSFHPTNWGVTAKERNTYVPKHLKDNLSGNEEYTDAKNYPLNFYNWIHYTNYYHRVFWSESEHFFSSSSSYLYPATGAEPYEPDYDADKLALSYMRYSDIDLDMNKDLSCQYKFVKENEEGHNEYINKEPYYLREHTFSLDEWKHAENPDAVPTSLIVYGYYDIKFFGNDSIGKDGNHNDTRPPYIDPEEFANGFFIRDVGLERANNYDKTEKGDEYDEIKYRIYMPKNSEGKYDLNGKNDLYNALLNEQYTIFIAKKDKYGETIPGEYKAVKADDKLDIFVIRNTYQYWNGKTLVPAPNQYTLQLKDWSKIQKIIDDLNDIAIEKAKEKAKQIQEETGADVVLWEDYVEYFHLYFGQYDGNAVNHESMQELTSSNLAEANKMIQQTIWAAQYFDKAKGFFFGPIPHYLSKDKFTGKIEYKRNADGTYLREGNGLLILDHLTGDFGIVRNHIYNITVNSIKGLGYGKPDGNNIILPQPRPHQELYMFDMILEIIPWNKFEYTFDL